MDFSIFTLFCVTVAILTITPGPDIIFVVSQSLNKGYKYGIKISIGLVAGLSIYTIGSIYGISTFLDLYPKSSSIIKVFGAFYIGFLAYIEFTKKKKNKIEKSKNSNNNPFFVGLVMNISNPKVMLFFASIFPQFIFHNEWPVKFQFLILGIIFISIAFIIFIIASVVSSILVTRKILILNSKYLSYFSSFVLGGISVFILLSEIKNFIELNSLGDSI